MERSDSPTAKCGTTVLCFAAIILLQGWLLRGVLLAGPGQWPGIVTVELVFCLVMLAALIWCWGHPKGWTNNLGCIIAFGLFAIYLIFNLFSYEAFAQLYLAGLNTEFPSWGKALVALKLVLALMAVVAGIPAAPALEGREYADKLRQAVYRQEAEWAKGSAKGAKKDFESAMGKLRETLSQEELDALLAQLRAEAAPEDVPPAQDGKPAESVTDSWQGWGGGM